MQSVITSVYLLINNEQLAYIPSSISYMDGTGEQQVVVVDTGGGVTQTLTSDNVESKKSVFKVSLPVTIENEKRVRGYKANSDTNGIQISFEDSQGNSLIKSFQNMTLINEYEVGFSQDGKIELEFAGPPISK